jgi:hypothetical protein
MLLPFDDRCQLLPSIPTSQHAATLEVWRNRPGKAMKVIRR